MYKMFPTAFYDSLQRASIAEISVKGIQRNHRIRFDHGGYANRHQ